MAGTFPRGCRQLQSLLDRPGDDLLLTEAAERAPLGELVDIMDVGFACAYLATPYARRISGGTLHVDGGMHIMA